ncbi:MAG: histidinol-phosphatase [bacterium]|nr:histidinol-phosphatase [bacterium]
MTDAILYDTHMHTPLCKHAFGEPEAYAEQAARKGLKGIVFTCHSPMNIPYSPHLRMDISQFDQYVNMVERARLAYLGQVDVRLGLESDYFPGAETWLTDLHSRANFDYLLGSVHPQMAEYQARFYLNHDMLAFHRTYYEHLAMAAETGLFDCISHPDVIKFVHPRDFKPEAIIDSIRDALDRIAAVGVAMELNTSGLNKAPHEMYPSKTILAEMAERGIPVVIGSDSHDPKRVGADFEKAMNMLESVGINEIHFFLERQRHTISIPAARESLVQPGSVRQMVMDFAQKFI